MMRQLQQITTISKVRTPTNCRYKSGLNSALLVSLSLAFSHVLWQRLRTLLSTSTPLLLILCFNLLSSSHSLASQGDQPPSSNQTSTNSLYQHASPYLAMHGHDPIEWFDWSANVLKQAQKDNKLILISSGYFSCHWCHVMQRENYLHLPTAQFINKHFISVKIDRELNPELDKTLIEFSQKATGQAGWPQHVVLTPEGYPFAAFIYLPNQDFNQTLKNIQQAWQEQPNKIRQIAQNSVIKPSPPTAFKLKSKEFELALLEQVSLRKDEFSGGLKGSSKFPEAPLLMSLLQISELPVAVEEWLILTLDQMQSQHLFDHVHGGFYRYTIDPEWQTPHFEKMAYTSALLADLYLQAGQRFNRVDYLSTAQQTLSYLEQHLYNPITQLYQSSQSAIDLRNEEGGDYLWSKEALQKQLTPSEFSLISSEWALQDSAPYDDLGWHPRPLPPKNHAAWQSIRLKLQTDPRKIPLDSKSILGWNGLILSAYTRAYSVLKMPHYLQSANALAARLIALIQQKKAPRALSQKGKSMGEANLQDYAFIYQGLIHLQHATGQDLYQQTLKQLEKTIQAQFYSESGWQYHAAPLLPGQQNEWQMIDNAIPSPAAIVSCLQGNGLSYATATLMTDPIAYSSYLSALHKCPP